MIDRLFRRLRHAPKALVATVALLATASQADARPLDLGELHDMEQYLVCAYETCKDDCAAARETPADAKYEDWVACERCLSTEVCGNPARLWEKDGVAPVTLEDHELAVLEQLYPSDVCYADSAETIVRPPELCEGGLCESFVNQCLSDPDRFCSPVSGSIDCREESFGEVCWYTELPTQGCPKWICDLHEAGRLNDANGDSTVDAKAECLDLDQDGLPAWAERELAGAAPVACPNGTECGIDQVCARGDDGSLVCQAVMCDTTNPCDFYSVCQIDQGSLLSTCVGRVACEAQNQGNSATTSQAVGEVCDTAAGACVACWRTGHCDVGQRCAGNECVAAQSCSSSLTCVGANSVCDTVSGFCVQCVSDAECADGVEVCGETGVCELACDSDLGCVNRPYTDASGNEARRNELCDPLRGHCTECVDDSTCGTDGVCVMGSCRKGECSDNTRCFVVEPTDEEVAAASCPALDCDKPNTSDRPNCTAFHLEKVAEDDVEVLIHVYNDFTPIPARVLDLYLNYDDTQLTLEDARPLPSLQLSGKELTKSHLSDGTLVLSVFDKDGTHAVPNGPVVELVFRRIGICPTEVAFTERTDLRERAVAPLQGSEALQAQLGDDALWGDSVRLCARSSVTPTLRLWYGFQTPDSPLDYANIPNAEEMCELVQECKDEPDAEIKARFLAKLGDLQSGELVAEDTVLGVRQDAVYFDGGSDHMRLPISYEEPLQAVDQGFTLSTWFYTEGNSDDELADTPQLLYTHNNFLERTGFGLMSIETGGDQVGLFFFVGDVLDPQLAGRSVLQTAREVPPGDACAAADQKSNPPVFQIARNIAERTWHHLAFKLEIERDPLNSVDNGKFTFYLDGEQVGCVDVAQPPSTFQCPQFYAATDLKLHEEGDILGGTPPEYLYSAVRRSNLYKIERTDPNGLQSKQIIGDTEFNYQDPDYSPILDRLVYSSNLTGSNEIWIANGDGSNQRQLTVGFGDSNRNISARRPRFAPDGSGIVFDSNVYDVLDRYNTFATVRHIYFIGYNAVENVVEIPLADGSTATQLDFNARIADQTIKDYRLTSAENRHHRNARWLTGKQEDVPDRARGALLLDSSKSDFSSHRVQLLTIPAAVQLASTASVPGLGQADEVKLINAMHTERAAFPEPIVTEKALIVRENQVWEYEGTGTDPQRYESRCVDSAGAVDVCVDGDPQLDVRPSFIPTGTYDERCWDSNYNNIRDSDEDRNKDDEWNELDCYPYELDIYFSYDSDRYTPVLDLKVKCSVDSDCGGGEVCHKNVCELGRTWGAYSAPTSSGTTITFNSGYPSLELCSTHSHCGTGELCFPAAGVPQAISSALALPAGSLGGICVAIVTTVLPCSADNDCLEAGQICDYGQCKLPGDEPVVCLESSDCRGDAFCYKGFCYEAGADVDATDQDCVAIADPDNPTAGVTCGAKTVCSASATRCVLAQPKSCTGNFGVMDADNTAPCAAGQRCENGVCKVLGWRSDNGPTQIQSCVLNADCAGGQYCLANMCFATATVAECANNSACNGGTICDTSVSPQICRKAAGATPGTVGTGSCQADSGCDGGFVCDAAANVCKASAGVAPVSEPGEALKDLTTGKVIFGKKLRLSTRFADIDGSPTALVRVQLLSPQSAKPINPGEVAIVRFEERFGISKAAKASRVVRVLTDREVVVKDLTSTELPTVLDPAGSFDILQDGAFSPDGDQLMLAAVSDARPILLRTQTTLTALDAERIVVNPVSINGLQWVRQERFYPCNWLGGYQHLQSKAILSGFRGAFDDLKLHGGARDPQAIRSEAERGREFLVKAGLDAEVDTKLPSCGNSHSECPAFHLCIESECQMVPCDPEDPWSCADSGGRCTLRPASIEQENTNTSGSGSDWDWICAADCVTDNQCFTETCLNGPCRYCENTSQTCIECREGVTQLGALQIAGVQGCPDQRSFNCLDGACVTECYSFEDGDSVYLCDTTTEFCDRGRCVLLEWDWWDLAPATMAGGGEPRLTVPPDPGNAWNGYTQAVDQRVPITVTAYGVEDWLSSPEMVVEVRGGPFYNDNWSRVAKVLVHNRTRVEALSNPYTVSSPYPFNDMRFRMVQSEFANLNGGATGFRDNDDQFCIEQYLATVKNANAADAALVCSRQAQGSRYALGYPSNVAFHQAIADCRASNHTGCPVVSNGEHDFLQAGNPAVVVLDVLVDGGGAMNAITANRVCHYEGGLTPVDNGAPKKVVYGRFGDELSNQAADYRADCEASNLPSDFRALWSGDESFAATVGSSGMHEGDGVANGLALAAGKVRAGLQFDFPADYLSVPPETVSGDGNFSVEAWVRSGDARGGLLSVFARPKTCAEWKERGRITNGTYTIWPDVRPIRVYCNGMDTVAALAKEYIELAQTDATTPGANVSSYVVGGGSTGTPVRTAYRKLRFHPEDMSVDVSDQTYADNNGGRIGHNCGVGADLSNTEDYACFVAYGALKHLWRGEYNVEDAVAATPSLNEGITFGPGRIGQALVFGPDSRIATDPGFADGAVELSVDAWVKVDRDDSMVLLRQGAPSDDGAWELALTDRTLTFSVHGGTERSGDPANPGDPATLRSGTPLAVDTWHHVTATLDVRGLDPVVKLYVDGNLVAQRPDPNGVLPNWDLPELAVDTPVVVGQGRLGARNFVGSMDDVAVWAGALTGEEVANLHRLGTTTTAPGGSGFGICLPEEVQTTACADESAYVTTLPLGVAYGCIDPPDEGSPADADVAVATIDLRGTPLAIAGIEADGNGIFTGHGDHVLFQARASADGQKVTLVGNGSCGGVGPAGWSGDPRTNPPESLKGFNVRFVDADADSTALLPADCDAACLSRTVDEVLAVDIRPKGLEVRLGTRVHTVGANKSTSLSDQRWHHVAIVRGNASVQVWVDGESWLSTSNVPYLTSALLAEADRFTVGQSTACAFQPEACRSRSQAFQGIVDELALYDRKLTPSEIVGIAAAGSRGRPTADRPGPTCLDPDIGLQEFSPKTRGYALLNCNYYDAIPTAPSASISFQNVPIARQWPAAKGAIIRDDGDICLVELTPSLTQPCYAWYGNDVQMDGANDLISFGSYVPFQSLEVSLPRSFGHDEGFDSIPAPAFNVDLTVSGLSGSSRVGIDYEPRATSGTYYLGADETLPLASLPVGREFSARVIEQPMGWRCGFLQTGATSTCGTCASGSIPDPGTGVAVALECAEVRALTLDVSFFGEGETTPVAAPDIDGRVVISASLTGDEPGLQQVRIGDGGVPISGAVTHAAFDKLLPINGDTVVFSVTEGPAGFSCVLGTQTLTVAGDYALTVSCSAASRFPLQVDVSGLNAADGTSPFSCQGPGANALTLQATTPAGTSQLCFDTDEQGRTFLADGTLGLASAVAPGFDTDEQGRTFLVPDPATGADVDLRLLPGESWSLEIVTAPTAPPARYCTVAQAATGAMVDGGLGSSDRPAVVCVVPTNLVVGQVVGLEADIELELVTFGPDGAENGRFPMLIPEPEGSALSNDPVDFSFTGYELADDVTFRVEVSKLPLIPTPDPEGSDTVFSCTVSPDEFTTPIPDGLIVVVSCEEIPEQTYTVGGSISGLTGNGLRLELNLGANKLDVPAYSTSFQFEYDISSGDDWDVSIDRQPEGQACTLGGGALSGTVNHANVNHLKITCQNLTKVRVTVQAPAGYSTATVRAMLINIDYPSYMAARSTGDDDDAVVLVSGTHTFELPIEDPPDDDVDPNGLVPSGYAALKAGNYALYVMLSNTKDDEGNVTFPFATPVAYTTLTISNPLPAFRDITLSPSAFTHVPFNSTIGIVKLDPDGTLPKIGDGQRVICAWSPSQASAPRVPFDEATAPVIGFSRWLCSSSADSWSDDVNGCRLDSDTNTTSHTPLPPGVALDVTCWGDANGVGDGADKLSHGDLYGRRNSATVPSDFSTIEVDLNEYTE